MFEGDSAWYGNEQTSTVGLASAPASMNTINLTEYIVDLPNQYWPKFCYKVSCDGYIHSWKFEDYDGEKVTFDNLRNNGLEDCTEVLLPNFLVGWVNE